MKPYRIVTQFPGRGDPVNHPDERLIRPFASGTDELLLVSVYAESKRFVVFRIEGHSCWAGRFSPRSWSPTRHVLIHKGQFMIGNDTRVWTGRVTKAVAAEIAKALKAAEKAGKIRVPKPKGGI
jgi:hypothetical protein